ncbi:hypothetical protein EK21DRAFT_38578, partial [Setomelanomma holmii]
DAQLLTVFTTFANYNRGGLCSSGRSVVASKIAQTNHQTAREKHFTPMAHHHSGSRRQTSVENELWFSMPSSSRRQGDRTRISEQSAYQATSYRMSTGSSSSIVSRTASGIPLISTPADTNKPLPPSPPGPERRSRKPTASLRSFLGRPPSSHLDPNHLQPEPYNHRHSATSTNLSVDTNGQYHHAYSRSMPSSPYEYNQASTSQSSRLTALPRAQSAASDYTNFTPHPDYTSPLQESYPVRTSSMHTYFETSPPRARTFPTETSVTSPTMREGVSNRPRPHTWLSPTESFSDASQFSLFVQATTGLPDDSDPWSPNAPPQLQGSLFARRSGNDTIPLPLQRGQESVPR